MSDRNSDACIVRGVLAGALGGLVAAAVMNGFIAAAMKAQETMKSPEQKAREDAQNAAQSSGGEKSEEESEDSTIKVADAVTWLVTGQHLGKEGKQKGGPIVHYAFGTLMGALYGTLASLSSSATAGTGTAFGATLFVVADEVMVPALITGQFPTKEPPSSQLTHFAAHLVYGATTELVRRIAA